MKSGFLMKRSSGKMIKQWNRRKFFLRMDGSITYDSVVGKKSSVMYLSRCVLEPRSSREITKRGDVYVFTIQEQDDNGNMSGKLKLGSKDYDYMCSWYHAVQDTINSIENETRPWNRMWNLREKSWDSDTTQRRLERLRNEHAIQTYFISRSIKVVESVFLNSTKMSPCPEWFEARNSPIPSRGRHIKIKNYLINIAEDPQHAKQLKQEVRNVINLRDVLMFLKSDDDVLVRTPLVCLVEIMGTTALVMADIEELSMKHVVNKVLENDRWHFLRKDNDHCGDYILSNDVRIEHVVNRICKVFGGLEPTRQGTSVALPSVTFLHQSDDKSIMYAIGGSLLCPPILSDSTHRMMLLPSESDQSFEILNVSSDFSELKAVLGSSTFF